MARFAAERQGAIEEVSQRIRLNEASARREVAEALERASQQETISASLRMKVSILRADLAAAGRITPDRSYSDELYDSTTKRLRKFPSLAAKPDA